MLTVPEPRVGAALLVEGPARRVRNVGPGAGAAKETVKQGGSQPPSVWSDGFPSQAPVSVLKWLKCKTSSSLPERSRVRNIGDGFLCGSCRIPLPG